MLERAKQRNVSAMTCVLSVSFPVRRRLMAGLEHARGAQRRISKASVPGSLRMSGRATKPWKCQDAGRSKDKLTAAHKQGRVVPVRETTCKSGCLDPWEGVA